jgi:hypothetical protein
VSHAFNTGSNLFLCQVWAGKMTFAGIICRPQLYSDCDVVCLLSFWVQDMALKKILQEQDIKQLILYDDSNKQLSKDEDCSASILRKTVPH